MEVTHPAVDFSETERNKWGSLCVKVTCPDCGKIRFAVKYIVTRHIKQGSFTGLCRRCHGTQLLSKQGPAAVAWKGGRRISVEGYIVLTLQPNHPYFCMANQTNGRVYEHRLVMAEHIGKPLPLGSVVHHEDENKTHNDIENLRLLKNRSEHNRIHARNRKVA